MNAPSIDAQEALDLHNKARREAPGGSRPDLVWSKTLEAAALEYAKKLVRMNRAGVHDLKAGALGMGENLMVGSYSPNDLLLTLAESARGWVEEKKWYNGEPVAQGMADKRGNLWGHYTQVISTRSTEVGIAYACGPNVQFVVARYRGPQVLGDTPWRPELQMVIPPQPHVVQQLPRRVCDSTTSSKTNKRKKKSFLGSLFGGIMGGNSSSRGNSR